jgi:hypothetical protein
MFFGSMPRFQPMLCPVFCSSLAERCGRTCPVRCSKRFGRKPQGGYPAEHSRNGVTVQAARRRALAFRATGRRTARFTDLRRALPERLVAVRLIFALRAGFAFFFAIFAIVFLSFSFPSFQFCP